MADPSSNGHNPVQRHLAHERAFTAAAAGLLERSPIPITSMAEQRAPLTPISNFAHRDFAQDGLEELADCRNYIAWLALRLDVAHRGEPDAQVARAALQRALAHVVEAFAELNLAKSADSRLSNVPHHA